MAPKTSTHNQQQLHLFFFPFMSPGHQIPMLDMAILVASRGVKATIVTTPLNLSRFRSFVDRHTQSGDSDITLHVLDFPSPAAGLPQNCENLDSLPSRLLSINFSRAIMMLHPQADDLVRRHQPDAIISDVNIPWTAHIARKYDLPRIVFYGTGCFPLCVIDSVTKYKPYEGVNSDFEPFLVPGLPHPVRVSKSEMPVRFFRNTGLQQFFQEFVEADRNTYGVVANTFCEIEPEYIEHYRKISGKKVWPVGPLSLCNQKAEDMAERGNRASLDTDKCLTWLDSKEPNSVIYVCFGSLCAFAESQLVEIRLGLEGSNCNFIWVIKDFEPGLEGLEEMVECRGLIIKGWAPQVRILSHPAVGGFMTHCGWNSVLEAVSFGVPVITWPLIGEQGYNENLLVSQWKVGFSIGVDTMMVWGEEEKVGAVVKRGRVREAVSRLMGGGESVEEMRRRAGELRELARSAVKEGGSSSVNLDRLVEYFIEQKKAEKSGHREGIS